MASTAATGASTGADPAALEAALAEVRQIQQAWWPPEVPRTVDYPLPVHGIVDYLRHWAQQRPDATAIAFYGRDISYAEYDEMSDRFGGWLLDRGARPGDRIGVHLTNCPQVQIAMLGILKIGAVYVPINPMFREHELRYELSDAGVTILLTQDSFAALVEQVRPDTPVRHVATTALSDLAPAAPVVPTPFELVDPLRSDWHSIMKGPRAAAIPTDPDALAALNYTGGTTGMPKGCEHTQRHMVYTAATATVATGRQVGEGPLIGLCYLPMFWIAGEDVGILCPLINGGTVVLMNRWDPGAALILLEHYRATTMLGTVDNYVELMDHPGFDGAKLAALDNATSMSFVLKLDSTIRQRWRAATGQILREVSYGMTETNTLDTVTLGFQADDYDLRSEPVFCGVPVPGTDVLIVDAAGAPVPLGQAGQIIVRSPAVLSGYYNNPDATAASLRDGWLHTGDVGKLDERGALHYLARDKEMIKTSGMSVFPSEVEALLAMHPQIQRVAVVPMPDAARGQIPVAFIEPVPGADIDGTALRDWAAQNMAVYKVPLIEIVDAMPMTATGKIRKVDLATRVAELAQRAPTT